MHYNQRVKSEKIIVLQTTVPFYRVPFFRLLKKSALGGQIEIHCGLDYWDDTTKLWQSRDLEVEIIRNQFFFRKTLLFQVGLFWQRVNSSLSICELNPRVISTWLLVLSRRVLRRDTVFWGHAFPRSGHTAKSLWIRKLMCNFGTGIIAYNANEAEAFKQRHPSKPVFAAPNALYESREIYHAAGSGKDIVFVGRCTEEKDPMTLLRAFHLVQSRLGESKLHIVGKGPLLKEMEDFILSCNLSERVILHNEISDLESLRQIYFKCFTSVVPGFVGLSLVQSLGFGVPAIISTHKMHAPEVYSANEGNSIFFEVGNVNDLAKSLIEMWDKRESSYFDGERISREIQSNYSMEDMVQGFSEALDFKAKFNHCFNSIKYIP